MGTSREGGEGGGRVVLRRQGCRFGSVGQVGDSSGICSHDDRSMSLAMQRREGESAEAGGGKCRGGRGRVSSAKG